MKERNPPSEPEEASAQQRIEALSGEKEQLTQQLQRTLADMQNLRRQTMRQLEEGREQALVGILAQFLPVLDALERAAAAGGDVEELRKGLSLTVSLFRGLLERHGLERIPAEGAPFDPSVHEAVLVETRTDVRPGTVTAEVEPGYRVGERVVRPAKVAVSQAEEPLGEGRPGPEAGTEREREEEP